MMRLFWRYSSYIFFCFFSTSIWGAELSTQQGEIVRSSAEPGRIAQSLTSKPLFSPAVAGKTTVASAPSTALPPEVAKVTFKLTKIRIVGATVFPEKELVAPYRSYLGKTVSLGDIAKFADEMTTRYQKRGYVLTRVVIPPQHILNGVITLRVVEGFIDKVSVQGNVKPNTRSLLLSYGQHIRASRPLHIKVLERYALLANDLAGIQAKVVLLPSKTTPGSADLTFVVRQSSLNGYASVDNRGTHFLGPQQFSGQGNVNSLFRGGDSTALQVLTTGDEQLNFANISHEQPLGSQGAKLHFDGSYSRSVPGSSLETFDVIGRSTTTNIDASYPLIRSRSQNFYAHGGMELIESSTDILSTNLYDDRIRVVNAGLSYNRLDGWRGLNKTDVSVRQGLDILGASSANDTDISRPGATPTFAKLNASLSRLQDLPYNLSLLLAAQGQYTDDSLYASEQFGFGGSDFGRGYDPSEIIGDRGIAGKAELRYNQESNQFYAFYDIGSIWNRDTVSQSAQESAASLGLGVRSYLTKWLAGDVVWAKPLTHDVAAEENRNPRVFFSLTVAGDKPYKPRVAQKPNVG